MGEDYPSETFRVLKENEIQEHGLDEKGIGGRSASSSTPTTASLRTAHSTPRASRTPSTSRSCAGTCGQQIARAGLERTLKSSSIALIRRYPRCSSRARPTD